MVFILVRYVKPISSIEKHQPVLEHIKQTEIT